MLHSLKSVTARSQSSCFNRLISAGGASVLLRRNYKRARNGLNLSSLDPCSFGPPHTWYPKARKLKRHVYLHVGPTNSGKTYEALERLQAVQSGLYCGPLRLLAWEIYDKLNTAGVACDLWTGQEIKEVEGSHHVSCTVEMADISRLYDCAVIDECQLLGDRERGWAWTRAILGIPALELHLCGSPSFIDIVERLCEETGDSMEIREYQRLSPLKPSKKLVKSWSDIQAGDAIVAFSRKKLFQLKNEIEVATDHRVSVVYGGLPPEARREQARLFNDEKSGFNVLVASDAIGMGLNLSIGRIIFSTMEKFDGEDDRYLTVSEIKQIAGRAGRFQSRFENGLVAARKKGDMSLIHQALEAVDESVMSAGLKPTREQLELFAQANGFQIRQSPEDYIEALEEKRRRGGRGRDVQQNKKTDPSARQYLEFHALLELFVACSKLGSEDNNDNNYFLCDVDDMLAVARLIEEVPMPLADRYTFCIAPVDTAKKELMSYLRCFAVQFARSSIVRLEVDIDDRIPSTPMALKHLEEMHAITDVYLWLGIRYGQSIFIELEKAVKAAEKCSDLIEKGLRKMGPVEHRVSRSGREREEKEGRRGGRNGEGRGRRVSSLPVVVKRRNSSRPF